MCFLTLCAGLQIWDGLLHLNNGRGECLDGRSYGNVLPGISGAVQSICSPCSNPPPPQPRSADLALTKVVNVSSILLCPGEIGMFTINVTNLGPDNATFVTISDVVPSALVVLQFPVLVSGALPGVCFRVGSLLSCDFDGVLLPNASVAFSYTFAVNSSISDFAFLDNMAVTLSSVFDPRMDNNAGSALIRVGPCNTIPPVTPPPLLPPIAVDDKFTAMQDMSFSASLTTNDTTYGKPFSASLVAPINAELGIVSVNSDGTFILLPTRLFVGNIFFDVSNIFCFFFFF